MRASDDELNGSDENVKPCEAAEGVVGEKVGRDERGLRCDGGRSVRGWRGRERTYLCAGAWAVFVWPWWMAAREMDDCKQHRVDLRRL